MEQRSRVDWEEGQLPPVHIQGTVGDSLGLRITIRKSEWDDPRVQTTDTPALSDLFMNEIPGSCATGNIISSENSNENSPVHISFPESAVA